MLETGELTIDSRSSWGFDLDPGDVWKSKAVCAQTDPEAFFPEKGGSTRQAKRICLGCEVRKECLQYALDHEERFGIWGGLSERERRRLERGDTTVVDPTHNATGKCIECGTTLYSSRGGVAKFCSDYCRGKHRGPAKRGKVRAA